MHIRNKIITFTTQSTNKKNYICPQECVQIKPKNWKQFRVKAPRNLKSGELYEIDFNGNGFPEGVIPLTCTFIAGTHQKFIHVNLINQGDETAWIPRGQHIGIITTSDGWEPSQEEVHEILHQFQNSKHQVNEMKAGSIDDFITNGDQVQQKRPVEHKTSAKVSPEMKKKLAQLIEDYADIFSKNQYDVGESTHPPIEIPTEGAAVHIGTIHDTAQIQTMGGQHTQQFIRSRNDPMHHEHVGITGYNCTQKRLADQPG